MSTSPLEYTSPAAPESENPATGTVGDSGGRDAWRAEVNAQRLADGLPPMTPEVEDACWALAAKDSQPSQSPRVTWASEIRSRKVPAEEMEPTGNGRPRTHEWHTATSAAVGEAESKWSYPTAPSLQILFKMESGKDLSADEQMEWDAYEVAFKEYDQRQQDLGVVDLAEIMRSGITPPKMLIPGLLAEAVHHIIYGTKESAKTWVLLVRAGDLLMEGYNVIWVDEEMGRAAFAERLAVLGVSPETVEEHFTYLEYPILDGSPHNRALWCALLEHHRPSLVVIDSQTEVLAAADANENLGTDVAKWHMHYLAPALKVGSATVTIDHTGHGDQDRAVGSRHKGAQSKVELKVTKTAPFDRDTVGGIRINETKNTHAAAIPKEQFFEIGGDGQGGFTLAAAASPVGHNRDEEHKVLERRRSILAKLRSAGDGGNRLTSNQIAGAVGGNKVAVLKELALFVEQGVVLAEPDGPQAVRHSLTAVGNQLVSSGL